MLANGKLPSEMVVAADRMREASATTTIAGSVGIAQGGMPSFFDAPFFKKG